MDAVATVVEQLLTMRSWVAHDIDDAGRVLAGHDELGTMQLVEVTPDGERTALTALPGRCEGRYVPGRRQVLVLHDHGGDEHWQISLLDLDAATLPASTDQLQAVVHDPEHIHALLEVRDGSIIYSTNRRNGIDMDVIERDLATGAERVVHEGGWTAESRVSHDGRRVALTALSLRPASTTVSVAGPDGVRQLTDPGEHAAHRVLGWSGDDTALVLDSTHGRDMSALVRVGLDGTWRTLVAADDHMVHGSLSPDAGTLLVQHHVDGRDTLALHDADGTHRVDVDLAPASLMSSRWARDGSRVVLTVSRPTLPSTIVVVDAATGRASVRVDGTDLLPPDLRGRLTEPSVHRIPTPDGEQVPCFLFRPDPDGAAGRGSGPTPDAEHLAPCVLHIHGGPESEAVRAFSPMLQALALTGLSVVVPNVRGSNGYGRRWLGLDDVDLRLDAVADLAAIHDWLPGAGLDPHRAALWGGSYGGYMVLAGVSMQPGRWAAGVDIVGMSSLVTFLQNTSAWRRAYREREYGSLEHDMDLLVRASPLTHLDAITAPLFVIHGTNDPRVPLSEAEQIKQALDDKGIDCELRVYPDEGHGLSRRENRLDAYPAAIRFLVGHLLD